MYKKNKLGATESCTPVSSNCVIWQGPCLSCIEVNTGDSISETTLKLANEICELKEQLDLSDLEISCLLDCNSCPEPEKTLFNVLELLIARVCSLDPNPGPEPDPEEIVVTIAACFQYVNNDGDLVTSMKLSEYAKAIGIKVCSLQTTIQQHTATLGNHETRITALENASANPIVLPKVTPVCVLPSVPTDMNVVLSTLESQFCGLRNVTGLAPDLSQAIAKQCVNLNNSPALSSGGTMAAIAGWKTTVATVADSLNNMWLTICDMRAAVASIKTCCDVTCDDLKVDFLVTLIDNGSKARIYFAGYTNLPTGFTDCSPSGSLLTITDSVGGVYNMNVNIATATGNPDPIVVDFTTTPLSPGRTYSFTLASCLTNSIITCNKSIVKTASGEASVCSIPSGVTATIN